MFYEQSVYAIKPPDEKWRKMKAVWDTCKDAGVCPPKEVCEFFGDEPPHEAGVVEELGETHPAMTPYSEEMRSGWEVDLSKLPSNIKILRFVHSYD